MIYKSFSEILVIYVSYGYGILLAKKSTMTQYISHNRYAKRVVLPHMRIYIGPYTYGTSHMRILIWDARTRMGQHFVTQWRSQGGAHLVSRGQTSFLALGVIACSISAQPKKGLVRFV